MKNNTASILIIYTGGTIGMIHDKNSDTLIPVDFERIKDFIPELMKFNYQLTTYCFSLPLDSSNMSPGLWIEMVKIIEANYNLYDGFVILHGTDTMAYTSSALSFLLENLGKPVILTGSQLPLESLRTDAKENLITSIEIAAAKENEAPIITEVCIYFEYQLYRGNRTHKYSAENFEAFRSSNYPILAEAGVEIRFNKAALLKRNNTDVKFYHGLNPNIAILKLFPGFTANYIKSILNIRGLKAVILETYGSGNAPLDKWFIELLKKTIEKGIIILNISQCNAGSVDQGRYETGAMFQKIGVIGGKDMTIETAVCKLMFLLENNKDIAEIKKLLPLSLRGELTE
jgi:L-asparaginase